VSAVLRYRLLFGPILIAAIVLVALMDQWIEGRPVGEARGWIFPGRETAPAGVAIFIAAVIISFFASRELSAILKDKGIPSSKRVNTTAAIAGLLVSTIVPDDLSGLTAVAIVGSAAVGVLVLALLFHSRRRSTQGLVAAAGGALLCFVYLGLMFGFILAIRRESSAWVLLWVLLVVKSCDIGAYFTGRSIGRHKLIPWLSPGKTWEGLGGGVVLAALVGAGGLAVLARLDQPVPPVWTGLIAGVLFGVTGQAGDLIASMFKRDAGRKDSSRLLPGFGGVLDVLDSPLLVAPAAFWWVYLVHSAWH
jgi:phosphatidate cytidylyltransferase